MTSHKTNDTCHWILCILNIEWTTLLQQDNCNIWSPEFNKQMFFFSSLYWMWSLQSEQHNNRGSVKRYCPRKWNTAKKRTIVLFYYLCFDKARLQSESTGQGINQKVSILLAMAAGANNMIIHINNRPNSWASQRTYKGRRQKAKHWIRQQFRIKWIPSSAQIYWSVTEVLLSTWPLKN